MRAARAELVERGVEVGEVQVFDSGSSRLSREGESLDNVGVVFFSDPDGNRWVFSRSRPAPDFPAAAMPGRRANPDL